MRGALLPLAFLAIIAGSSLFMGCAKDAGPEAVALEYMRALYATDLARAYRLISTEDRRAKDEETFLHERDAPTGFALELAQRLAGYIEVESVDKTLRGERATVTLKLRLPNANAPEIAHLVHEWDERRLNALPRADRAEIARQLTGIHQAKRLPVLEGEETLDLVREGVGWRIFLNWVGGVLVRFSGTRDAAIPIQVTVTPDEARVSRGERFQVTLRVRNLSEREIVTRVAHRIEPEEAADSLALLQCPLFVPVSINAAEVAEFRSEYVILKDASENVKQFHVTYEFLPVAKDRAREGTAR